ncbi:MAG: hypothetical protein V4539_16180 [Bacteroidota bacterium]
MSLAAFFDTIADDPRITTAHVSVYLAMMSERDIRGDPQTLAIERTRIMQLAKINARSTYDKVIHDLAQFGYIKYYPDFGRKSKVVFNKL